MVWVGLAQVDRAVVLAWHRSTNWQANYLDSRLNSDEPCEDIPFEEDLDRGESTLMQQANIFIQTIGNQDFFERLSFLGDLQLRISVAAFEIKVEVTHQSVHCGVGSHNLFAQDEAPIRSQRVVK